MSLIYSDAFSLPPKYSPNWLYSKMTLPLNEHQHHWLELLFTNVHLQRSVAVVLYFAHRLTYY